ncbi:unnamed protein product [Nesidiocoris tenuis]|uniref:Uncharacterized protein n=1 Tax=Nesidiocoris tenuis TaxID=355587 RepID=A0A6H5GCV9_9HEMI|nr:unnamed protein product [Nesidiocoris tenuis]
MLKGIRKYFTHVLGTPNSFFVTHCLREKTPADFFGDAPSAAQLSQMEKRKFCGRLNGNLEAGKTKIFTTRIFIKINAIMTNKRLPAPTVENPIAFPAGTYAIIEQLPPGEARLAFLRHNLFVQSGRGRCRQPTPRECETCGRRRAERCNRNVKVEPRRTTPAASPGPCPTGALYKYRALPTTSPSSPEKTLNLAFDLAFTLSRTCPTFPFLSCCYWGYQLSHQPGECVYALYSLQQKLLMPLRKAPNTILSRRNPQMTIRFAVEEASWSPGRTAMVELMGNRGCNSSQRSGRRLTKNRQSRP